MVIADFGQTEYMKVALKSMLLEQFSIAHSTLEFEVIHCDNEFC